MTLKIVCSIVACVIAIVAFYLFFIREDKGVYEANNAAIPTAYQSYQQISPAYDSDVFEIEKVYHATVNNSASPNPIRVYQSVGDHLIVDCDARKDEDSKGDAIYFKIDKMGLVTDSLYVKYTNYWTILVHEFMVHTDENDAYFTTWPQDGDTTRQAFEVHNKALDMPSQELRTALQTIKKESRYFFVRTYVRDQRYMTATYFYKDHVWQVLWQETQTYQSELDIESAVRYQQELYRSGEPEVYLDTAVTMHYFHPHDKVKYFHIIGGGAGGFSNIDWRGMGFFETQVGESPFQFSITDLVIEKERHDSYRLRLYQVYEPKSAVNHVNTHFYQSPFGFALYTPQAKILYVIREKTPH